MERGASQKDVDLISVHPDWKPFDKQYDVDIAIFVLTDIVDFSNYIRPVCMPGTDELIDDTEATIVGWGVSEYQTNTTHELVPRETTTWVLNSSYCFDVSPHLSRFASTRAFCGGGDGGSPNSGDSGGGIFIRSGFAWIQYGIISSTLTDRSRQRRPTSYSLYTSVPKHINWITETVKMTGGVVFTKENGPIDDINIDCDYAIDSIL